MWASLAVSSEMMRAEGEQQDDRQGHAQEHQQDRSHEFASSHGMGFAEAVR
jgi:hypothetical protein